jgi:hypothetical protein
MKRPFLERPNDWLRTQRTAADVVRDAYAIQAVAKAKNRSLEIAAAVSFIIGASALYFWR